MDTKDVFSLYGLCDSNEGSKKPRKGFFKANYSNAVNFVSTGSVLTGLGRREKERNEDDGCLPTAIITEGAKLQLAKKSTQSSKKIEKGIEKSIKRKVITEDDILEYVVKKAVRFSKKFDSEFVWEKKIRNDLGRGVALDDLFSVEALNKRRENARTELENVRERREKRRKKKIIHEAQLQSRSEDDDQDHDDDRVQISSSSSSAAKEKQQVISPPQSGLVLEEGDDELAVIDSESVVEYLKKPKFLSRVRTGYQWNRYNRIHYDSDNPPPKAVQGYKFDILYPDLPSTPSYSIERDDVDETETCILRFHAGEPYQDIAFRIVNAEWDYSPKNGFKCTFESGILRLHFNLKRLRYRR